ncbi:LCCL domain-containing protein [Sabulicella rubraurantiaca]|uniref:LCCL domain-containing protein n=1 Tax=Sabulicella rubraurantiaca TaxID=2811429 RepID=UPI001A971D0A|nr:LCCL domain-containing protein [Sabulicella rubraurantiaca]
MNQVRTNVVRRPYGRSFVHACVVAAVLIGVPLAVQAQPSPGTAPVQAPSAEAPRANPLYARMNSIRLSVDFLSLPEDAAQTCGLNTSNLQAAVGTGFRDTGVRLLGAVPPPNFPEAEWVAMPELIATASVLRSEDTCYVSFQLLLLAPSAGARLSATGVQVTQGFMLLWMHSGATRKPFNEASAEVETMVREAAEDLGQDIARANVASPGGAARAPAPAPAPAAAVSPPPAAAIPPAATLQACPERWRDLGSSAPARLECLCSADAIARTSTVWGTDVYTDDSALCRAALHAGAVPVSGGRVTVLREAGRTTYAGSTRNGVATSNYGEWNGSFRFEERVTRPPEMAAAPAPAPPRSPGKAKFPPAGPARPGGPAGPK